MPRNEDYFGDMVAPKPLMCFLLSMVFEFYVIFINGVLFFFYDNMDDNNTPCMCSAFAFPFHLLVFAIVLLSADQRRQLFLPQFG